MDSENILETEKEFISFVGPACEIISSLAELLEICKEAQEIDTLHELCQDVAYTRDKDKEHREVAQQFMKALKAYEKYRDFEEAFEGPDFELRFWLGERFNGSFWWNADSLDEIKSSAQELIERVLKAADDVDDYQDCGNGCQHEQAVGWCWSCRQNRGMNCV